MQSCVQRSYQLTHDTDVASMFNKDKDIEVKTKWF